MPRAYALERPGVVAYDAAVELMRLLEGATLADPSRTTLLLLEHRPIITIGRNGQEANVLAQRVEVRRAERGGDVTWHGPGQIVGYPVLHLREHRLTVRSYVEGLEEVMIRVARRFDVAAGRRKGLVGVWVGPRKVGALGVRVRRHVATHGFALNVANDLEPYRWIHPCGMPGVEATSLTAEVGSAVPMDAAYEACARAFEEVFGVVEAR